MNPRETLKFVQKHYHQEWSDADIETMVRHIEEQDGDSCLTCIYRRIDIKKEPCKSCWDYSNFKPISNGLENILPE